MVVEKGIEPPDVRRQDAPIGLHLVRQDAGKWNKAPFSKPAKYGAVSVRVRQLQEYVNPGAPSRGRTRQEAAR